MMSTLFVPALVFSALITGEARSVAPLYSNEISQGNNIVMNQVTAETRGQRKPEMPTGFNISSCLFSSWKNVIITGPLCTGKQLCYGLPGGKTKFAVCYDTAGKIPQYAAYVMEGKDGTGGFDAWTTDASLPPADQASVHSYSSADQIKKYGDKTPYKWNITKQYFLSKGHLTPNVAFQQPKERSLTYVLTNAAPQWQKFNGGNWNVVEEAIKKYAVNVKRGVYVLTGVHGTFKDTRKVRNPLPYPVFINSDDVNVPEYFWTIVCDPSAEQSIAFIAENNVGDMSSIKKSGCNSEAMSSQDGVVKCMSVARFITDYHDIKAPVLDENCHADTRGTFLDPFYQGRFQ